MPGRRKSGKGKQPREAYGDFHVSTLEFEGGNRIGRNGSATEE